MTVREAQQRIDAREFAEWIAYSNINPFGEWRGDLRMAITTATIANANRGKKVRRYKPKDFMPQFHKPKQTSVEMFSVLKQFTAAHRKGSNGNDSNPGREPPSENQ